MYNKVYLMKKSFTLKMIKGAPTVECLNKLNTIVNQLISVEIIFGDEVYAPILLVSLPKSWESMRAAVSNSIANAKLKFVDVRDIIFVGEVCRRDVEEASISSSIHNVENKGRSFEKKCWKWQECGMLELWQD